jgi:hypothetical protein
MNDADKLVEAIAEEIFGGVLPPFVNVIVGAVLVSVPPIRGAREAETQRLTEELTRACYRRLQAQHGA